MEEVLMDDNNSGRLVIPPFSYTPLPNAHLWLKMPDDFILSKENVQTLPLVVSSHFFMYVSDFRS
jgi:hypothetical protein